MKKIMFPICEREYFATQGRVGYLVKSLAKNFSVEFWTPSKEVYEDIHKKILPSDRVTIRHFPSKYLPLTFDFRNNLAKIFVKYTHDISIPGTDLKLWKTAAFDDFWGHVATCSFPGIPAVDADLVLLPLLSYDDIPWEEADVFYTSTAFQAKEAGIPAVGYPLYPVFNTLMLMSRLVDAVIVKNEYEKQFYIEKGFPPEKLHLLTEERELYALSTIEDNYKNHLFNSQIEIARDELGIVVCNHGKLRPQLREIFNVIGETKIPAVLSLLKRDFVVREIVEEQIVKDIFLEDIKKTGCRFYLVESQSLVPLLMVSDLIISPTFVAPLEFAAKCGKEAWVYNPFNPPTTGFQGVTFINKSSDLASALERAISRKKKKVGMGEIANRLLGRKR